jgi:hypothetical protein
LGFAGGGLVVCFTGAGTDEAAGGSLGSAGSLGIGDGAALVDGVTFATGTMADVLMPGAGLGISQAPAATTTTSPAHTASTFPGFRTGTC